MSDLQAYFLASERTAVARERHSYAGEALKNAQIWERLAELKSQHKPAATLLEAKMTERDRLYAAAFWVVVGRMPEGVTDREPCYQHNSTDRIVEQE